MIASTGRRTRVAVILVCALMGAGPALATDPEILSSATRIEKKLKKLRAGAAITVARDASSSLPPAMFAEVAPSIRSLLTDRGYRMADLSEADLFLTFDLATDALDTCIYREMDGREFVSLYYEHPHLSTVRAPRLRLMLDRPNVVEGCPIAAFVEFFSFSDSPTPCPESCEFRGFAHRASVSVYDAGAYRKKKRLKLLWNGVAVVADFQSRFESAGSDDHSVMDDLMSQLVEEGVRAFPSNKPWGPIVGDVEAATDR